MSTFKKLKSGLLRSAIFFLNLFPFSSFRRKKLNLGIVLLVTGALSASCSGNENKNGDDAVKKTNSGDPEKVTCYEMTVDTIVKDTL